MRLTEEIKKKFSDAYTGKTRQDRHHWDALMEALAVVLADIPEPVDGSFVLYFGEGQALRHFGQSDPTSFAGAMVCALRRAIRTLGAREKPFKLTPREKESKEVVESCVAGKHMLKTRHAEILVQALSRAENTLLPMMNETQQEALWAWRKGESDWQRKNSLAEYVDKLFPQEEELPEPTPDELRDALLKEDVGSRGWTVALDKIHAQAMKGFKNDDT